MRVTTTDIPGLLLIEPDVFRDPRGLFLETYHARRYKDAGIRTITWDHPVSEPTRESTPAAKPLIDRLGQLYPDPPEIVDPEKPPFG